MTTGIKRLPGLSELWNETQGTPGVTIAVLDGPVDLGHPCFQGADLELLPTLVPNVAGAGRMSVHGTHVASMLFGQPGDLVRGVVPACRGLIVPIYSDTRGGPVSQVDLARAINQAVEAGAHVINVSGGELSDNGEADPTLLNAVRNCHDEGVLIVAATGNNRCRCLHVPAALPSVLAVGASDWDGLPLECSNWGEAYQTQGVLAPGLDMVGASPGGGVIRMTGSSFATPIVAGVAGLLLSLQRKRGLKPDANAVREAILTTAIPCDGGLFTDCQRFLVGRLNVRGAHALISQTPLLLRGMTMLDERTVGETTQPSEMVQPAAACLSETVSEDAGGMSFDAAPVGAEGGLQAAGTQSQEPGVLAAAAPPPVSNGPSRTTSRASRAIRGGAAQSAVRASGIEASDCSCQTKNGKTPIFALGVLNYDFGTEARRDTFKQLMPSVDPTNSLIPYFPPPPVPASQGAKAEKVPSVPSPPKVVPFPPNPYDPRQMVNYLAGYPRPQPPHPTQGGFPNTTPAFPTESPAVPKHYPGFPASPWDAAELIWTLNIELTPIYAIRPFGSYSAEVYQRLIEFLDGQTRDPGDDDYVERVSIPGYLSGETVRLYSGQVVPVLVPNLRGMFGWNTRLLIDSMKEVKDPKDPTTFERSLRGFLDRVYFDLRNLGQTPGERALNFAVTNAFQTAEVFEMAATESLDLDAITYERSPFCRKDSDCWDVKIRLFNPKNVLEARRVARFTVDVSDYYPVLVGPVRQWAEAG